MDGPNLIVVAHTDTDTHTVRAADTGQGRAGQEWSGRLKLGLEWIRVSCLPPVLDSRLEKWSEPGHEA